MGAEHTALVLCRPARVFPLYHMSQDRCRAADAVAALAASLDFMWKGKQTGRTQNRPYRKDEMHMTEKQQLDILLSLLSKLEIDERDTLDKLGSFASDSSQWHYYHGQLAYINSLVRWLRAKLQTEARVRGTGG